MHEQWENLKVLTLKFRYNNLSNLNGLSTAINYLKNLEEFYLDLGYNRQLIDANLNEFKTAFANSKMLKKLTIYVILLIGLFGTSPNFFLQPFVHRF